MGKQDDRDRYYHALGRVDAGMHAARALRRHAATYQRLVLACANGEIEPAEYRHKTDKLEAWIEYQASTFKAKTEFQDDPRGACVKLILPNGVEVLP